MTYLPRIASLALLLTGSAGACAVTVTEGSGGAGGTGTASSTTGQSVTATGTGGVPSTTTTGGFGTTSITGSSTGPFTTAVSSTATGTGGWTSVSSSSAGGGYEPCVDYNDLTIINNTEVFGVLVSCGMMYIGNEPQNLDCLVSKTGLSQACATCYDSETHCILQSCLNLCASAPMGPQCTSCRAQSCDPTFMACSGLNHGP